MHKFQVCILISLRAPLTDLWRVGHCSDTNRVPIYFSAEANKHFHSCTFFFFYKNLKYNY